jgi:flagellar biosynthesis protein FlhB
VDRAFTIEGCSFPRIWIASTAALVGFSILAITAQAIQGGWVWRPAAISPRWSRLASWEAALRFAHSQAWIKTSLSFATLVLVSSLAVLLFWRSRMDLFPISGGAQASILIGGLDLVAHWLSRNTLWIVAAIGVMGLAEYAFRKLQFERSMQLSADQFREALRELEGNGRIRRLHARRSAVARQQVARQQR